GVVPRHVPGSTGFWTYQPKQRLCKSWFKFGQVNTLQAVTVGPQGRVLLGQVTSKLPHVVLGPNSVVEFLEADLHLPADAAPVEPSSAELFWFWTFVAIGCGESHRSDAGVGERKDEISRCDLAHELVERI